MADSAERANLVAEIFLLRRQQLESIENAAFVGWTVEAQADHDKRADRVELLLHRLAQLHAKA
jgi:hypothetical protein